MKQYNQEMCISSIRNKFPLQQKNIEFEKYNPSPRDLK